MITFGSDKDLITYILGRLDSMSAKNREREIREIRSMIHKHLSNWKENYG